jgi:murein DD-endopeptidase MepM/ murein hydrolase activator NlpD
MELSMRNFAILTLLMCVAACIPPGRGDYALPQNEPQPQLATDSSVLAKPAEQAPAATWQARGVIPNAATVQGGTYVVQPGDTLRGIANKTGAGSQVIAATNGLVDPYVIRPGQQLQITGGRYHKVNSGETGIAIARAYGTPWNEIVALNDLEEPYILRLNQKLLLPATTPSDPANMSIEQRAAAFNLDIDDIVTGSQPALAEGAAAVEPSDWRKTVTPNATIATPGGGFAGQFIWPVNGKLLAGFGAMGDGKVNDGLNIAVPSGTPIRASADGVVAYSGDEIGVFGGLILIKHGSGWVTAYGHADKLNVARGQKVVAGEIIGLAGDSGYVQEPQLHFEIRKDRKPVNPISHLPKRS